MSIDGLQPEHDVRRTPATYDRILKHIVGHQVTVHCTVTRQQVQRDGYLEEFVRVLVGRIRTRPQIWVSLYTPQIGEVSDERLLPDDRQRVVADLMHLRRVYPEAAHARGHDQGLRGAAVESRTSACSRRRRRASRPTSSGRSPRASSAATRTARNCGCIASAGLGAIARHRLPGGLRVGAIFEHSLKDRPRTVTPRCGVRRPAS